MKTAKVGLGIGLGYVLGRKKKLRAALLLGAAAAAARLPGAASGGGGGGGDSGSTSPKALGRLGEAGISAARSAVTRPVTRLGDRLNASAEALRGGGNVPDGAANPPEQGDADEHDQGREREQAMAGKRGGDR